MKFKKNKGFTLLEIIIVVAIIAVLAVILLPRLARVRQPANDARRIQDLRAIQGFLELYYQTNRNYPMSVNGNIGYGSTGNLVNCGAGTLCETLITNQITNMVPNDPVTGQTYQYGTDTNGQSYVLAATLQSPNSGSLADDIDGNLTAYSIDCGSGTPETPPVYCIQF